MRLLPRRFWKKIKKAAKASYIAIHGIPVFCDVDDTLVVWGMGTHPEAIDITMEWGPGCVMTERLVPHKHHIEMLKQHKFRGHKIVVWSAGGSEWAEKVVQALGLEDIVDLVIGKPIWFYDDIQSREFLPESSRIYVPIEGSKERLKKAATAYGIIKPDDIKTEDLKKVIDETEPNIG